MFLSSSICLFLLLLPLLLFSYPRNHFQKQSHKIFLCFFLCLMFRYLINFELIFVWCKVRIQFHSLARGYPIFSNQKKLSFPHCVVLALLSKIIWPCMWGFISGFSIVLHWSVSSFRSIPYSFDFCSFVICFKTKKYEGYNLVDLAQNCFGYLRTLKIPYEF